MEQHLAADTGERQLPELILHHEIKPLERPGKVPGASVATLGIKADDRRDDSAAARRRGVRMTLAMTAMGLWGVLVPVWD
jgi:hypothetical protein